MKNTLWLLLLCIVNSAHAELAPISNEEMDAETGQSGVAISLEMRLNADANGNSLCGTAALSLIECRLAFSLNNRGKQPGGVGTPILKEWLVFKGVYGRIYIPRLTIDADTVTYTSDVDGSSQNIAAVKLGFGSGVANKIQISHLTISNIAMEYDTSAANPGYIADPVTASPESGTQGFLGLEINGAVEYSGSVKIFACNANHPRC